MIKIGIVGCGRIFKAHLDSIIKNSDLCELVSIADINQLAIDESGLKDKIPSFINVSEMFKQMKDKMNMVVIATPNDTHYNLAVDALKSRFDILVEKPVTFSKQAVLKINDIAVENKKKAFAVLQVRYNPSVLFLKKIIDDAVLGKIRTVSLVQRWQRPDDYFNKWFGDPKKSGGVLYEVGIHYLDIVQWLFGIPEVFATKTFKLKPNNPFGEDTIFSIVEYAGGVAGSIEVGIASEPSNLECSLTVIGDNGYVKIGGKALNEVVALDFNSNIDLNIKEKFLSEVDMIQKANMLNYGVYTGSCPNHPILYKNLFKGNGISLLEASNCIEFIEKIYSKS
jgi:UDP-N-acetyl-2-amino-2-deoxyglucuronate dehydrogenase